MPQPNPIHQQLRILRQSVTAIERAGKHLAASLNGRPATNAGRRLKLSPQRRAALKLHGRYLGYIRQLKAKVKAVQAKKGYHAAIALAKRLGLPHVTSRQGHRS